MTEARLKVRLLFADSGTFHQVDWDVPASRMEGYDRLIDSLKEDQELLKGAYFDEGRLCAAWVVDEKD